MCTECKKIVDSKYYVRHREEVLQKTSEWKKDNPEKVKKHYNKEATAKWRRENRDKYLEDKRRRKRKNLKDPKFRIGQNMSKVIAKWLRGLKAGKHWEEIVGYSSATLTKHLEKQFDKYMTWENYGSYWQIDHVIPISVFNFTTYDDIDFKRCWGLKNLRPLEKNENRRKHNKTDKDFQPSLAL